MLKRQDATGNINFYDLHLKRNPLFLKRNIRRVLDSHRRNLQLQKPVSAVNESDLSRRDREDCLFLSSWEMLKKYEKKQCFWTNITAIKPIRSADGDIDMPDARPSKKKGLIFRLPCQFALTVWQPETGESNFSHRYNASISAIRDGRGNVTYAVELAEGPIRVPAEQLGVQVPPKASKWKQSLDLKQIQAHFNITFLDSDDKATFMSSIQPSAPPESSLTVKVQDMTKFPKHDHLLPIFLKDNCQVKPSGLKPSGFGLEVSMALKTSKGRSTLEAYNRALKSRRANQLPSPVSDTRSLKQDFRIIYSFKDRNKNVVKDECRCCHCPQRFRSLDDLHLHLKTDHDLFSSKLIKKEMQDLDDATLIEAQFECEISSSYDQRASDRAPDATDVMIVAPTKPFNQTAYLEGNEEWVTTATLTLGKRPGRLAPPKSRLASVTVVKPKPADEIVPRKIGAKKKYRVPRAPSGINFYRTVSKRPLEEGELVSESDDDVDMHWLKLRRRGAKSDADIATSSKKFMRKFDDHVQEERLTTDVHVGDAVVRFALQNQEWLQQKDMAREFTKKITELYEDRVIAEDIYERCLTIAEEQLRKKNKGKGRHRQEPQDVHSTTPPDTPPLLPQDGDIDMEDADEGTAHLLFLKNLGEPEVDKCICGKPAESGENVRELVWCENSECIRHCFHIACVARYWNENPNSKAYNWLCPDCRG